MSRERTFGPSHADMLQGVAACILDAMTDVEITEAMGWQRVETARRFVRELHERWGARNRVHLALKLREVA